jgi:hypothetical protein
MVTVLGVAELSFIVTLVAPAATPVTVTVDPLMETVATDVFGGVIVEYGNVPPLSTTDVFEPLTTETAFGVAIIVATVTGTLTVDVPALSFTTMVAVPTARPVTESLVPVIAVLTFVVSEFDFTE